LLPVLNAKIKRGQRYSDYFLRSTNIQPYHSKGLGENFSSCEFYSHVFIDEAEHRLIFEKLRGSVLFGYFSSEIIFEALGESFVLMRLNVGLPW